YFFFSVTVPSSIFPLSLHDALPILCHSFYPLLHPAQPPESFRPPFSKGRCVPVAHKQGADRSGSGDAGSGAEPLIVPFPSQNAGDRKSTRLNSSHVSISYAVFCLKK